MRLKIKQIIIAISLIIVGAASARILDFLIKSHSELLVQKILNNDKNRMVADQVGMKLAATTVVDNESKALAEEHITTEELVEEILDTEDLTYIECHRDKIAVTKAKIQNYHVDTYFTFKNSKNGYLALDKVKLQLNEQDMCEFKNINNKFVSKRLSMRVSNCEFINGPDIDRLNECCSRGKKCIDLVNEWL